MVVTKYAYSEIIGIRKLLCVKENNSFICIRFLSFKFDFNAYFGAILRLNF